MYQRSMHVPGENMGDLLCSLSGGKEGKPDITKREKIDKFWVYEYTLESLRKNGIKSCLSWCKKFWHPRVCRFLHNFPWTFWVPLIKTPTRSLCSVGLCVSKDGRHSFYCPGDLSWNKNPSSGMGSVFEQRLSFTTQTPGPRMMPNAHFVPSECVINGSIRVRLSDEQTLPHLSCDRQRAKYSWERLDLHSLLTSLYPVFCKALDGVLFRFSVNHLRACWDGVSDFVIRLWPMSPHVQQALKVVKMGLAWRPHF